MPERILRGFKGHRCRHTGEAGFVLASAVIVLFAITVLTGAAIAVAVQTSISTTRDNNNKAALEAAEAGLQVASYRLSTLEPKASPAQCINGIEAITVTSEEVESKCKDSSESLGNGASFKYWTTLPLAAGEKCAGTTVVTESSITQRCVTAEGKSGGFEPAVRLQLLVKAKAGQSLFSVHGLLGLEEVKVSGSVNVPALAASNGTIKISGGAALNGGYEIGPKGKFVQEGGASHKAPEKTRTVEEGEFKAEIPTEHATAESNEDSRITACEKKGCATSKQDEFFTEGKAANSFAGSPTYELKLSSNSKLTLSGSKYYLCNFIAEHTGELIIPKGAKVEIFIDSEGGSCPAKTGKFETGEFILNNEAGPGSLLVMMKGKGPFTVASGAKFEGAIYAPGAIVTFKGGTKFKGGIVAKKVFLENGNEYFEWSEEVAAWKAGSPGAYGRKAWEQCTRGSGAKEGC